MRPLTLPDLPDADAAALRAAVQEVIVRQFAEAAAPSVGPHSLSERLPSSTRLVQGAEQLAKGRGEVQAVVNAVAFELRHALQH